MVNWNVHFCVVFCYAVATEKKNILIKILGLGGMETSGMFYYTYSFLNQSTKSIN